jgi:exonuclease SbcC
LGDPRRNYQRAADTAEQREEVEKDLAAAREHVSALEEQIAALDESLVAYVDLDEQWETQRETREAHEPDHQRYLEHVREAEALEERQGKVASLSETLKDANVERDRLVEERDQIAGEYDADAYAEVVETYTALRDEVATLEERLRQHGGQLEEAQAEIDRLTGVQEELAVARTERAELDDLLTLLEHLRGVLRDAGPKVTQALVEVISLQAARLYAEIMADHTARLRWTEDYEIVLTSGGRERTFQQLSGGEQMAAALSVRLALLREVSSIDVAFFDEPTANLEDHRRDNLAEQIQNVRGFSQLFVISHDDTFERDTDNVIRLVKENGVSRAVVHIGL